MISRAGVGGESRRAAVARWSGRCGLTALVARAPRPAALTVLTYHRIGDPARTPFDAGLFSATAEDFDAQMRYLRRHFRVLSLPEALAFIDEPKGHPGGVLITFDDGYLDNFRVAFPILQRHSLSATFFLATSLVGTATIPWWDRLAYCVRHTSRPILRLRPPWSLELDRSRLTPAQCLKVLLQLYKSPGTADAPRLLAAVEDATGVRPQPEKRRFLNWVEASEMVEQGMHIGSHTHSHDILSRLAAAAQLDELTRSRTMLENRLGIQVQALAYPDGANDSFNSDTIDAAKAAGYRAAFSYDKSGINFGHRLQRFNLLRLSVDSDVALPHFSLRVASTALSGKVFI